MDEGISAFRKVPALVEHLDVLDPVRAFAVMSALCRPTLCWRSSEALGYAGRGSVLQIHGSSVELDPVRHLLTDKAHRLALTLGYPLVQQDVDVQVFFVRMHGDATSGASQLPHVDRCEAHSTPPICTCVYFVEAIGCVGGELSLLEVEDGMMDVTHLVVPKQNAMVIFPGNQLHAVNTLRKGSRVSAIINFFDVSSRIESLHR